VAIGTLVPLVVGHFMVMLTSACRAVGISVVRCLYETARPAAVAGALAASTCVALRVVRPPASASAVIVEGALVGAVYVMSLATVGFDRATRRAYAIQVGRVGAAVVSVVGGFIGRRATKVDPDGPLSSSVSVP
jgi:hypothetical protein